MADWTYAFALFDTIEALFEAPIDHIQGTLLKHGDRPKSRAVKGMGKKKTPAGQGLAGVLNRGAQKLKLRAEQRLTDLSSTWNSAEAAQLRERVSFFFGVMSVCFAMMCRMNPEWLHVAYSIQALYLLPLRAYRFKQRKLHYFMFDFCYFSNALNFLFLWVFPSSATLWIACYCLSHGSLAIAIITWRDSMVFHDLDKISALFIHIYPPLTFTAIRHFYPGAEQRFPALLKVPHMNPLYAISLAGLIYLTWQILYWKIVLVDRRQQIESGKAITSFLYLVKAKGTIGDFLTSFPPRYRHAVFMCGQLLHATVTGLPAVCVLYGSPFWSNMFLLFIFSVSVWNGGAFYIKVFGRKHEKELAALRRELAEVTARSGRSSPDGSVGSITDVEEPITPQLSPKWKDIPLVSPMLGDEKMQ